MGAGLQLCCGTGAELEEMMGRDEVHPSVGIPLHPSWVPTQGPEWGSDVHGDPSEVSVGQLVAEVRVCSECEIPGMLLS